MDSHDIFLEETDPEGDAIIQSRIPVIIRPSVWAWNVLGTEPGLVIALPEVSWWQRLWTRVFFGSTWEKI